MKFVEAFIEDANLLANLEVKSNYKWSESKENENKNIKRLFMGKNNFFFVEESKKKIGYICYNYNSGVFYLIGVSLIKSFQGKGKGKILFKKIEKFARGMGAKKIILEVWAKNFPAIGLYIKQNFCITKVLKKHYPNGDDKLVMEKVF
jgi:ribosomal protein S18 acetylase RimI-like enzyme